MMVSLKHDLVEKEIINAVVEITSVLKIGAEIDCDCCPGSIGISSQILVTIMGRIAYSLGVTIPDNCYIFHDKKTLRQLTLKEATQKLIKEATNGN